MTERSEGREELVPTVERYRVAYPEGTMPARLALAENTIERIHHAWRNYPLERQHQEIRRILSEYRNADADIRFAGDLEKTDPPTRKYGKAGMNDAGDWYGSH